MDAKRWRVCLAVCLVTLMVGALVPSIAAAAALPMGTIKGTVTGYDGVKLRNAEVVAYVMTGVAGRTGWEEQAVASTRSTRTGTYALKLPPGTYRIGFFPADPSKYAWEYFPDAAKPCDAYDITLKARQTIRGVNARLAQAGHISGVVVDSQDQPLAGMDVRLLQQWPAQLHLCAETTSAGDGTFEFTGLPVGWFAVWSYDPAGWHVPDERSEASILLAGEQVSGMRIVLGEAGKISGTVRDAQGTPIGGIQVVPYFWQDWDDGGSWEPKWELAAQTAVDGGYVVGSLAPADYVIRFSDENQNFAQEYFDDGAAPSSASAVGVIAGAITESIDAVLEAGGSISGTVTSADGPIVGGPDTGVAFDVLTDYGWESVGAVFPTSTGGYTARLPLGTYRVSFFDWAWDHVPEYWNDAFFVRDATAIVLSAEQPDVADVDAYLARPGHITGRITNAAGEPLENIQVAASDPGDGDWSDISYAATDANGNYDLPVPVGTWRVHFWDDTGTYLEETYDDASWVGEGVDVTIASEQQVVAGIDATLVAAAHIRGRVTDEAGNPIANIGVGANVPSDNEGDGPMGVTGTNTDDDGYYDLSVPDGIYYVDFGGWDNTKYVAAWYDDAEDWPYAVPVAVSVAAPAENIDAVLALGAHIKGHVTDQDGNPLQGIGVGVYVPAVNPWDEPRNTGWNTTDSNGDYDIVVRPGPYVIQFEDWAGSGYLGEWYDDVWNWDQATVVETALETPAENIDASLAVGAHITGTVTNDQGEPLAGISVNANLVPENQEDGPQGVSGSDTNENGEFDILVPTGEYVLEAQDYNNRIYLGEWYDDAVDWTQATPILTSLQAPAEGLSIVLARGVHVSGRVTDNSGNGLAGIGVNPHLVPVDPDQWPQVIGEGTDTDADGYFDLLAAPGTYIVLFQDFNDDSQYLMKWYADARDYRDATPIEVIEGVPVEGLAVTLDKGAHISGRLTNSAGDPLAGFRVVISEIPSDPGQEPQGVAGVETDENGFYDALVPDGTYIVNFGEWSNPTPAYLSEWYDDVQDWTTATPVTVTADTPAVSIDAILAPLP